MIRPKTSWTMRIAMKPLGKMGMCSRPSGRRAARESKVMMSERRVRIGIKAKPRGKRYSLACDENRRREESTVRLGSLAK